MEEAYLNYEFHKVFHTLHGLCATDLSSFYLDVLKDRLYSSLPDSRERRSAQTALYEILLLLLRDMAPVLSFTAEEAYRYLPDALKPSGGDGAPVPTVLAMPARDTAAYALSDAQRADWAQVMAVRAEVTRAIEPLRKAGTLGHSLDTHVNLFVDERVDKALASSGADMRAVCIVSALDILPFAKAPVDAVYGELEGLAVEVRKAGGEKCERCWIYSEELGTDPAHPTLCPRCTQVMRELEGRS